MLHYEHQNEMKKRLHNWFNVGHPVLNVYLMIEPGQSMDRIRSPRKKET